MALLIDASTPATVRANANTVTTASFTAPTGSFIVIHIGDSSTGGVQTFTVADTGGLTWTKSAANTTESSEIWWSTAPASSVGRTITVTRTLGVADWGFETVVITGQAASPIGAVNNGGTSTTQNITVAAITTTANNSLVLGGDIDDTANGLITSSDTIRDQTHTATGDSGLAYKAAVTPTSGTAVTLNFVAAGGVATHRWVAVEILAGAGAPTTPVGFIFEYPKAITRAATR